ncbi:MAG TPA: hypothetical protein VJB66_04390, partial [Candidatus Nanoarchaeia archaeon]|nr:hypothetical protein [Candidatus Nanoarchaeia archaeon]
GGQCQSRCTVPQEDSLLLTRYLMIWMVIFVIIAVIVVVLVTRKREERKITFTKRNVQFKHLMFRKWDNMVTKSPKQFKKRTACFTQWEKMLK